MLPSTKLVLSMYRQHDKSSLPVYTNKLKSIGDDHRQLKFFCIHSDVMKHINEELIKMGYEVVFPSNLLETQSDHHYVSVIASFDKEGS